MAKISYNLLGANGALGNQLWQIASTYGIAAESGDLPVFPADWYYRPFFNVPASYFGGVADKDLGSDYLQDLSHWYPEFEYTVRSMFRPSEMMLDHLVPNLGRYTKPKTAVHVRRANNATEKYMHHHPPCSLQYFEQAMDTLGGPFVIYSDSPEWCKKQSLFKDCEFGGMGPPEDIDIMDLTKYGPVGNFNAVYDLLEMSFANKFILSNSTFSWWSAFLSSPFNNDVIYPKRWFGEPLAHIDTTVMFDDSWGWIEL